MDPNTQDQTRIRDYLLGKLSENEQEKLEERLLLEDDLYEELEVSKAELIEEYRAADLPYEERQWLEQHFLTSSEGRQRYAMALTLDRLGKAVREPSTGFSWLPNLFGNRYWAVAAATAVVVVVIIGAVLLSRTTSQSVVGPTLASNVLNREQGGLPARFTIPANATEIKFRLLLPGDSASITNYRAELDNKTQVQPVKVLERDREGVWVGVPANQLPRGEYSLKLVAITPDGREREIPGDYLFNIE
jgi:hypothetical protein